MSVPPRQHEEPSLGSVAIGVLLGLIAFQLCGSLFADFRPGDAALGVGTVPVLDQDADGYTSGFLNQAAELGARARAEQEAGHPVALILGASQLHAINFPGPDDKLAVHHANQAARARGARLRYLQVSAPNGNLHELLCAYLAFRAAARPRWLVIALTYDDLKEPGVRRTAFTRLGRLPTDEETPPAAHAALAELRRARAEHEREAAAPGSTRAPVKRTATEGTPQAAFEQALTEGLERLWPAYALRHNLRSAAIVAYTVPLTNAVISLVGRRAHLVPAERQAWNEGALEALLAMARADGVRVAIYKPPHRPDEPSFYHDRAAYDAYFEALAARCEREGIPYADFERLVPAELWGFDAGYLPDVFHFQGEGHRRLGAALDGWLGRQ
ncbi:MAG TPA: hypothetical protein DEA08_12845 [Planctomycetes bacterium]|nr:hypothetical protein [Planctomycetota bacterium]